MQTKKTNFGRRQFIVMNENQLKNRFVVDVTAEKVSMFEQRNKTTKSMADQQRSKTAQWKEIMKNENQYFSDNIFRRLKSSLDFEIEFGLL